MLVLRLLVCLLLLHSAGTTFMPERADALGGPEVAYYVSPLGDDDGDGTLEDPFLTIAKARDVVRTHLASMSSDITVYIRGGTYELTEALSFTASDSGRNGYQVIYRNYEDEVPVIMAAQRITGWSSVAGKSYVQAYVGTSRTFETLYENGVRSEKARYPNKGVDKNIYNEVFTYIDDTHASKHTQFGFDAGDIPSIVDEQGAQIYIWPGGSDGEWNWSAHLSQIADIDEVLKVVELEDFMPYELGEGTRYFIQNAIELLDAPGEHYLDRVNGILYYYPRNDPVASQTILAPSDVSAISIVDASNLHFEGLEVGYTDAISTSLDTRIGAAIYMEDSHHITIKNNRIVNAGQGGIVARNGAHHIVITGNEVTKAGGMGISIEAPWLHSEYMSYENVIRNNHIYDVGQVIGSSYGINLFNSGENIVSHNRIHDIPRFAISPSGVTPHQYIGKLDEIGIPITAGTAKSYVHTRDNIIEFNDVFNANTDSQDTAPIYLFGTNTGNIVRNNLIHDSNVYFSFGYGLYFDDGSDGSIGYDNIIHHMQPAGNGGQNGILAAPLIVKGIGSKVYNNIVADNPSVNSTFTSVTNLIDPVSQSESYRNIFYNSTPASGVLYEFAHWSDDRMRASDRNVIYSSLASSYKMTGAPGALSLDRWRKQSNSRFDTYSSVGDPRFIDPSNVDYRLRYDSKARALGFQDIEVEDIGLEADYPFADLNEPLDQLYIRTNLTHSGQGNVSLLTGYSATIELSGRTMGGYKISDLLAAGATVDYVSDKPSVASVYPDGVIKAVSKGVARITVTATLNSGTASLHLYVLVDESPSQVVLQASRTKLAIGEEMDLLAYTVNDLGSFNNELTQLTFTSSNPSVLTVNAAGRVEAVSTGQAIITAASTANGAVQASVTIDVLTSVPPEVPNLMQNGTFETGTSSNWVSWGTGFDVVASHARSGDYSAKVEGSGASQIVTGLKPNTKYELSGWGKVEIASTYLGFGVKEYGDAEVAKSFYTNSYVQETITFTTGATDTSAHIILLKYDSGAGYLDDLKLIEVMEEEGIETAHTFYALAPGYTQQISVELLWLDESTEDVTNKAAYISSDASIATVSQHGIIKAIRPGLAIITVSYAGFEQDVRVEVRSLLQNGTFETGTDTNWVPWGVGFDVVASDARTGDYSAKVLGSGASQIVTGLKPNTEYQLSGWGKVEIPNTYLGLGVKEYGAAEVAESFYTDSYVQRTITFTTGPTDTSAHIILLKFDSGAGYLDDIKLVEVVEEEGIETSHTYHPLAPGSSQQITVSLLSSDESAEDVTNEATYVSSDDSIATVSQNGMITAIRPGLAIITVSYAAFEQDVRVEVTSLLQNGTFESGTINSWVPWSSGFELATVHARTGDYAAKVLVSGASQIVTGLKPNTQYELSGWGKVETASTYLGLGVKEYGGAEVVESFYTNSYVQRTITFTTGSTDTSAHIIILKFDSGAGYIDDVQLIEK